MEYLYPKSGLAFAGLLLLLGYSSIAQASDLSISSAVVNPGGTAILSVGLTVSGTAPAGLQWRISYFHTQISEISITRGPATSAAVKALSCATGSGVATCIVTGLNTNPLASGVVAYITATLAPDITFAPIQISNQIGTDSHGNGLSITSASSASIKVPSLLPVTCTPPALNASAVSTCTVTLTQSAPTVGTRITLASNNLRLTVPDAVSVPAGATTAAFRATAAASVAINQNATVTATLGGSTQTAVIGLVVPAPLSGVACSPAILGQGGISTCTVTLTQSAPTGGLSVMLASDNASLTVPASVTVAARATIATFSATAAAGLATNQSAIVTATLGSSSKTSTIVLLAPVLVSSVACSPAILGPSGVSTCTVTLNQSAPKGGSTVSLASNSAVLAVPASVKVAAGASTATFSATAVAFASNETATVTATLSGSSETATIILLAPVLVSDVACSPAILGPGDAGTCTVTLTQSAPKGGSIVTLASNSASLAVPASVKVSAGSATATFNATAATFTSNQTAIVTATLGSSSKSSTIILIAPVLVSALTCPTSISPGSAGTCKVTLTQSAPIGGSTVTLASNNVLLTVPASVKVTSGAATAGFSATAAVTLPGNQSATVTATLGSSSKTSTITGAAPWFIQEKDNRETSGTTSSATFSSPATAGNLIVVYLIWDNTGPVAVSDSPGNLYKAAVGSTLWNNGQYSVQTFYTINRIGGANTVTATFGTAVNSFGIIYALEYSGVAQIGPVDVTAAAAGVSGSLESGTVTTTSNVDLLFAGGASANTVTSPGAGYTARSTFEGNMTEDEVASAKGSWSASASNSGGAWAMQMVAFRGAAARGTATADLVSSRGRTRPSDVAVASTSAPAGGDSASANAASSLHCSPGAITAGEAVTCELIVAARSQSVRIPLTSSSEQVLIPAVVTTRPNQSSLTFRAETGPALKQQSVTITATLDTGEVQDGIRLMASAGPVLRTPRRQAARAGAPLSFKVSATDPYDLPLQLEGANIPAGASFDPLTGVFEWTPQPSQAGKYLIAFTATNSARQSSMEQVELEADSGLPVVDTPASSCSPAAIGTLRGKWLAAPDSQLSDPSGTSLDLGGAGVAVNGRPVPVLYSAADRVDFLCPAPGTGTQLSVEVTSPFGVSQPVKVGMVDASPTILSMDDSERNQGLISFYGTNDLVMERNYREPAHPAQPGDQIVIFATGLGFAAESLSAKMLVKLSDVYVGVDSLQAVPGYVGIYAIQVRVPAAIAFGVVSVQLEMMTPDTRQLRSNSVTAVFEAVRQ